MALLLFACATAALSGSVHVSCGCQRLPAVQIPRRLVQMKAPSRSFRLSDWYGEDWDHKRPVDDNNWVSPWAKAHYKLRQQEIEIEQCEYLLQSAIDREEYADADGLKQRVERLRSRHPIIPREERLAEALEAGNYVLAHIFQEDLDAVKANLGLPKYEVGQAVVHAHREGLRGIVMDVDLQCVRGHAWIKAAGCLERGCALGYSAEETDLGELKSWVNQPFYTVLPDLRDVLDEAKAKQLVWKWRWPEELAAYEVNHGNALPAPVYLSEDAILHDPNDSKPLNPDTDRYFSGFDTTPHRGRVYRPSPRVRMWQQARAKEQQELWRSRRANSLNTKNPYDRMK